MTAHAGPNYRTRIAAFQADDHGAVAMIFALVCMILVMFVGLAIDMGRVVHAGAKIESAIDAAALAGAKGLRLQNLSDAETTTLAKTMFDNNLKGSGGDYAVFVDQAPMGPSTRSR